MKAPAESVPTIRGGCPLKQIVHHKALRTPGGIAIASSSFADLPLKVPIFTRIKWTHGDSNSNEKLAKLPCYH